MGITKKFSSRIANPTKGLLTSASEAVGSLSSLYGSFSGGYGSKKDDCEGVSLALLLTTFASIGVVFFAVFTKLTMIIGRKKRSIPGGTQDTLATVLDNLHTLIYEGITGMVGTFYSCIQMDNVKKSSLKLKKKIACTHKS